MLSFFPFSLPCLVPAPKEALLASDALEAEHVPAADAVDQLLAAVHHERRLALTAYGAWGGGTEI